MDGLEKQWIFLLIFSSDPGQGSQVYIYGMNCRVPPQRNGRRLWQQLMHWESLGSIWRISSSEVQAVWSWTIFPESHSAKPRNPSYQQMLLGLLQILEGVCTCTNPVPFDSYGPYVSGHASTSSKLMRAPP